MTTLTLPTRMYPMTKIFDVWAEKLIQADSDFVFPYICEHPVVVLKTFRKFTRAMMLGLSSALLDELGFSRALEGGSSNELYEIRLMGRDRDELTDIVSNMRQAVHEKEQDEYTNVTISPLLRFIPQGRGKLEAIVALSGNYVGNPVAR